MVSDDQKSPLQIGHTWKTRLVLKKPILHFFTLPALPTLFLFSPSPLPCSPPTPKLLADDLASYFLKKKHLHKNCLSFPSPNLAANLHLCSVSVFLCAKKKDSLPCVCPVVVTARALDHALSGFHLQIALTSGPSVVLTTDRTWPRLFSERIHSSFSDSR